MVVPRMTREPKLVTETFVPSLGMLNDSLLDRMARAFRRREH